VSQPKSWITGNAMVVRPHPKCVDLKFAEYFFRGPADYSQIITGSAQPQITRQNLAPVKFPIAPFVEQARIVAKIDSLSAKSKRARDQLGHIPRLVEKYKQVVLEAAFRGELTEQWRTRKGGQPWSESSMSEVANIGTGSTPKRGEKRYYSDGHIPWVTSGAVNAPVVQSADEYITDAAIQETNCKVFPTGTILMAMYGEGQTRGRVAVLGIDAATNQALAAIQVIGDGPATRDFVLWHLRSGYLDLRQKAAGGVQPNLNLGIIKAWRIPLPSPEEQREIVRRVDLAFAWIDRLSAEATSASKLINHLDQAVLAKAFRGELVPQDLNDEPASALLQRIRGERATTFNNGDRKTVSKKSKRPKGKRSAA
jgi:type I restriction enzyme, S subunit